MKHTRLVAILLSLILLVTHTAPYASAAQTEYVDLSHLTTSGNYAIYHSEDESTSYCVVLDTVTGEASFAVIYAAQQDYVYEYVFDLPPTDICINSNSFWSVLIDDCLAKAACSDPLYIPDTITVTRSPFSISTLASTDSFEDYYLAWLESEHGSPYSMKNIYTGYRGANILFVYETLKYTAGRVNSYYVEAAISVASFILSLSMKDYLGAIKDAIEAITPISKIIESGTTIYEYYLIAFWTRHVRMKDSSHNLNITEKQISYTGYSSTQTGLSSVVESLQETTYFPSEASFNDKEAQIDDGYEYWMLNYA